MAFAVLCSPLFFPFFETSLLAMRPKHHTFRRKTPLTGCLVSAFSPPNRQTNLRWESFCRCFPQKASSELLICEREATVAVDLYLLYLHCNSLYLSLFGPINLPITMHLGDNWESSSQQYTILQPVPRIDNVSLFPNILHQNLKFTNR